MQEDADLIVGEFAIKDGFAGLAGNETLFKGLDEGHCFFEFGLRDLGPKGFFVDSKGD